jgi:hypothetical protein
MAILGVNPVKIFTPGGTYTSVTQYTTTLNFYHMVTTSGSDYYHFKTNITLASGFMGMIEFVGVNYGDGMIPIRAAASFYAYPPNDAFINVGLNNSTYSGGMTAHRVYKSSDNYACIVVQTNNYFTGFVLNSYTSNPTTPGFDTAILAVSQTANTTAVF